MLLEITRPVRREPTQATGGAQLQRAFQMPEFHPQPRERCERVDNQPTAVTGDVIALVGIRLRLDRTVDTDRMADPFVLSLGMGLASLGTGRGVEESTSVEFLAGPCRNVRLLPRHLAFSVAPVPTPARNEGYRAKRLV
ncbi:Vng6378h (plasmid) [Halobacterium salinarum NRC-1]|uniref:Spurious ORF n=1 Tax=Halobacterium salinarum (strain ATCC 700922 / JCM 11081 / NRC-1) TaxID=64091 RepID=Q9HHI5_HALSA|nr:Vng6378h [Halobacterium salinarum NRC-1]DAC79962.1 TPA_inf: spurious ORF [Halobacterium salinarum NRC-1]